jgi:hypothetical protein
MLRPPMDPRGQPILSFPDRLALGWAALLAGLFTLFGGLLLTGLILAEGIGELNGDAMAGLFLVAFLWLFGAAFSWAALRDVIGKPAWHVSSTHVWRTRGARTVDVLALRDQPSAIVVDMRRSGRTMWFAVQFPGHSLAAPSQAIARQIVELWQRERSR